jgi:xanthine dehydrogenase YagS FAD-binding subunit
VALAIVFSGDQAVDCRMVLSGAAPVPWRSAEGENGIKGRQMDRNRAAKVAAAALKNAEPMEQNEYKIPLFRGLVEQQLMAIAQPEYR